MSPGCTKAPCIHDMPVGARFRVVVSSDPGRVRTKSEGNYDGVTCCEVEPVEAAPSAPSVPGSTRTVVQLRMWDLLAGDHGRLTPPPEPVP